MEWPEDEVAEDFVVVEEVTVVTPEDFAARVVVFEEEVDEAGVSSAAAGARVDVERAE